MKQTTNVESGYLCHCLSITGQRFEGMIEEMSQPTFCKLKKEHGIGSLCSSCEYEAKGVLQEYLLLHPEKNEADSGPDGLREELGYAWGELKRRAYSVVQKCLGQSAAEGSRKIFHTGVFFMRGGGLESHLVLSNLAFPEHVRNSNGQHVTFTATLFGEDGRHLAGSPPIRVASERTVELSPSDLFPALQGDFVGGLYVEYEALSQAGSLRPYGVLVSTSPDFRARCHYHDKFGVFRDPGFFQNTSPFEPGQTCWMAASNCQPLPYATNAFLKIGDRKLSARFELGPMASKWIKLETLFPEVAEIPAAERSPALLWLENPQHIMVYFYWFNEVSKTWMGQHH